MKVRVPDRLWARHHLIPRLIGEFTEWKIICRNVSASRPFYVSIEAVLHNPVIAASPVLLGS